MTVIEPRQDVRKFSPAAELFATSLRLAARGPLALAMKLPLTSLEC
jgi:hypothetical protein